MASEPCDGCGREVPIAGGLENVWTFEGASTGGITLELSDGTEHFLCFECAQSLPEEPTAADVEAIDPAAVADAEEPAAGERFLIAGLLAGAILGGAAGALLGSFGLWLSMGAAIGLGLGVVVGRLRELRSGAADR